MSLKAFQISAYDFLLNLIENSFTFFSSHIDFFSHPIFYKVKIFMVSSGDLTYSKVMRDDEIAWDQYQL